MRKWCFHFLRRRTYEAFREGLRELGYVEGKNIVSEWRYRGKSDRIPGLVAELVGLKVDVIVTTAPVTRAAKEATSTIPIVMVQLGIQLGPGIVDSLARPGGNITGLTRLTRELGGKRLELLKEMVPVSRVGVFGHFDPAGLRSQRLRGARRGVEVKLQYLDVVVRSRSRDRIPSRSHGAGERLA